MTPIVPASNVLVKPKVYEADFSIPGDGWQCGSIPNGGNLVFANGVARSVGPWMTDNNHTGVGLLKQLFVRRETAWEVPVGGVVTNPANITNATMEIRARGVGFSPGSAAVYPWLQSRFPNGLFKFSNYGFNSVNLASELAANAWFERSIFLDASAAAWVYAKYVTADPNEHYGLLPLEVALAHLHNFFPLMAVYTGSEPIGTIELEHFRLIYLEKLQDVIIPPDPDGWLVILDPDLSGTSTDNSGFAFRGIGTPATQAGTEVKLTIKAPPGAPISASHITYGKQLSTNKMAATPIEAIFPDFANGLSLPAGAELSAIFPFVTAIGDVPIVHIQSTSSGQAKTPGSFAGGTYYKSGDSWSLADPGAGWSQTGVYFGGKIEVR